MNKYFLKYKLHIKIIILFVSFVGLYVAKDFGNFTNRQIENVFYKITWETQPDSNIVIIHISETDIEALGSWPIKRSYYALLINELSQLNVKKIGLEVFLSEKITMQSIYNDLLNFEIGNSGKVVLSSTIESYDRRTREGKINYPEPKLVLPDIQTGHLGFINDNGIYIPQLIKFKSVSEPSFSLALSGKKNIEAAETKLNILSGWKKFKHYSLIEFFNLFGSEAGVLKNFAGKTIIIGVSDELLAKNISSAFDERLPGVAIHAFALDNLLNNRFIKTDYFNISAFLIVLLLSLFVLFEIKLKTVYKYLVLSAGFIVAAFLLFAIWHIEIHYSLFLFPFLFILILDSIAFLFERKKYVAGILNETLLLKKTLEKKEAQLDRLQKELEVTGENASHELILQVSKLKAQVENIKIQEIDEIPVNHAPTAPSNFHGLVYKSKQISAVTDLIKRVAPENATVLIIGESGTGKELVAKAIHQLSNRRENNFVAVNCAALSDTLLESELFGHVKGAFTNAINDKAGRFETADNGTIFLDEIGEISENFQVKLLRILQTGEFEKVGSSKTIKVNARVVAATNKNLEQQVKNKKFREDLYYRLNVIKIELPPLRDRKEDIEPIANYFLSGEEQNFVLSKAVLEQLLNYEWRGNVRELESIIKRAIIFARSSDRNIIKLSDLPEEVASKGRLNFDELILESLREKKFSHSSINEIAKDLEISRNFVSENFRGIVFKAYYESGFNIDKAVKSICNNSDEQELAKVKSKALTFLSNVEKDVAAFKHSTLDEVKVKLVSKYKNLPQKFHFYLDEIIMKLLES